MHSFFPSYMYFFVAVAALVLGYFTYGKFVEKVFGASDKKKTPVCRMEDGVDYVKMGKKRLFMIQLLNIAGLGPILGPILGALYGPSALLWVVFGCIFAGAVHDYFSGMLCVRYEGKSSPEIVGYNLGSVMRRFSQVFMVVLLVLIGVVFVAGPAGLLAEMTGLPFMIWLAVIFTYFVLATLMPVDKIIGRLYPVFGCFLVFMAVGLIVALFASDYTIYNSAFVDSMTVHPQELPVWPMVFITIACGAISGFHCTQSTIVSRCMVKESEGRYLFYGAMVAEGIIALIWVTLGMSVYQDPASLDAALGAQGNAALVVKDICYKLLGSVGGMIAVIGVIVLPVTSGDTALRSARLMIADALGLEQKSIYKRLYIALPIFAAVIILTFVDFSVVWRYFGWANQTVAMIMLWTGAVWLYRQRKFHWICSLPAMFMTAVTTSYIAYEKTVGFNMPEGLADGIGVSAAMVAMICFLVFGKRNSTLKK